jgi:hypothetical protein
VELWEEDNFHSFDVVGKAGIELGAWWDEHHDQAYEGITRAGVPNLFNLPSLYSFTGLSYFFTIEGHMKYIARCLGEMRRRSARTFEVTREASNAYFREMQRRLGSSVFLHGNCAPANSYYFNQQVRRRRYAPYRRRWRSGWRGTSPWITTASSGGVPRRYPVMTVCIRPNADIE